MTSFIGFPDTSFIFYWLFYCIFIYYINVFLRDNNVFLLVKYEKYEIFLGIRIPLCISCFAFNWFDWCSFYTNDKVLLFSINWMQVTLIVGKISHCCEVERKRQHHSNDTWQQTPLITSWGHRCALPWCHGARMQRNILKTSLK